MRYLIVLHNNDKNTILKDQLTQLKIEEKQLEDKIQNILDIKSYK